MPAPESTPPADRFDHAIEVRDGDIDANGHANNVVYLRWVQEAAVAHWLAAVEPEVAAAHAWVVVRHEIDYLRPAFPGDALIAQTWLGDITAATTERFCELRRPANGEILAKSRTIWCAVDPQTRRPRRLDPRVRLAFFGRLPPPTDAP